MVSSIDFEVLQFFGFTNDDLKEITSNAGLQTFYELMVVPRKKFEKTMVLNIDDKRLYSIYKHLQKNIEIPRLTKILQKETSSGKKYIKDKKQQRLQQDKSAKISLLLQSIIGLEKDIEKDYLENLEKINAYVKSNSTKKLKGKTYKKEFLSLYTNVDLEKKKMLNQIMILILPILENSELLGDAILAEIVEDIIDRIKMSSMTKNKYFTKCLDALKRFLNSNVLLHHIFKYIDFDISKFNPNIKLSEIRLAKRKSLGAGRMERITNSCIDFKYTSNLFEQMIAFSYLMKGYDETVQLFKEMLDLIGFDPKDFVKYCSENFETPYPKIQLQPGCSCVDQKTKKSLCDNPGFFEPNNFLNLDCPTKCTLGKEFNIEDLFILPKEELEKLVSNLTYAETNNLIAEVLNMNTIEEWIAILQSEMIPVLQNKSKKRIALLDDIYFQYRLTKEDNELQTVEQLMELMEKAISKKNIGSIAAIYDLLMTKHKIPPFYKNKIKKIVKEIFM